MASKWLEEQAAKSRAYVDKNYGSKSYGGSDYAPTKKQTAKAQQDYAAWQQRQQANQARQRQVADALTLPSFQEHAARNLNLPMLPTVQLPQRPIFMQARPLTTPRQTQTSYTPAEPARALTASPNNSAQLQTLEPTGPARESTSKQAASGAGKTSRYNPNDPAQVAQQIRNQRRLGRYGDKGLYRVLGGDDVADYLIQRDSAAREMQALTLGDYVKNPIYAGGVLMDNLSYGLTDVGRQFANSKKAREISERNAAYTQAIGPKKGGGNLADSTAVAIERGAANFNAINAKTANFILGAPLRALGWEKNPIQNFSDAMTAQQQETQAAYDRQFANAGKGAQIAGDVGSSAVEALPDLILLTMSGVMSAAGQGETILTRGGARLAGREAAAAGARQTGRVAAARQTAQAVARDTAKNPMFWTSFSRSAGQSYEYAKEQGADEYHASLYALLNASANATVEIGGGMQTLPWELQRGGSAAWAWFKSMIEEGDEEVVQGVIERTLQNLSYGANHPIFSTTDSDAVINPATAAKEFGMGAAVAGLLGGPSSLQQGVYNLRTGRQAANNTAPDARTEQATAKAEEKAAPRATGESSPAAQVVQRLSSGESVSNSALNAVMRTPEFAALYEQQTGQALPSGLTNAQLRAQIRTELQQESGLETEQTEDGYTITAPRAVGSDTDAGRGEGSIILHTNGREEVIAGPRPLTRADAVQDNKSGSSTYIDTDPATHTPEEMRRIREYQSAVDERIKSFVVKVRTLVNPKYRNTVRLEIGEVSSRAAADVSALTGVDVSGFRNILTGSAVDHIETRHGSRGKADRSMADDNDLARVPYILKNYDGLYLLENDDGSPSVSDVWKNNDNTPAKRIVFYKQIDGTYYAVEAAPDSKAKVLAIESAFIGTDKNIKGNKGTVLNMANTPQVTPETPQRAQVSSDNSNVPHTSENVNRGLPRGDQTPQPQKSTITDETIGEAHQAIRELGRRRDEVRSNYQLEKKDAKMVWKIIRGYRNIDRLDPNKHDVKAIRAVVEAEKAYQDMAQRIKDYKKQKRADRFAWCDDFLGNASGWNDKKIGFNYSRETMERNIRDIVPDSAEADRIVDAFFTPVHKHVADATKMKNEYRDRVRNLNLSRKVEDGNIVSEAHAVQLYGEAIDNIEALIDAPVIDDEGPRRGGKTLEEWEAVVRELWKNNKNLNRDKVESAVKEFRAIYNEVIAMMNQVRMRNGYEPVPYRRGYFPHFQPGESSGLLAEFSKALGINADVTSLPTTINGLTHQFKPGIRWFGNAQERLGFNTVYDAVEGFDKYIEGAADVICLTDDIQNLRAFSNRIRYRASDKGIQERIDAIEANETIDEDEKQALINETYQNGRYELANFVVELDEYTNNLANKRSQADRDMEQRLGRNMYNLCKRLESRVAANMVALNPGSWLTNFIPLTQAWTTTDTKYLLKGMWQTLKSYKDADGFVNRSTFLTNRRGSDPIVKMWEQTNNASAFINGLNRFSGKAGEVLSSPMEYIDLFTSDSIVRARYMQNVDRGMSEAAAMDEADAYAAGIMADRSKGAMPTLFNRQNPVAKLFTQFQLEVNNELSWLAKDVPAEMRTKTTAAAAMMIMKFLLGAWLYNDLYELLVGRDAALDPIGILNDTVGDATGYKLPNVFALAAGAVGIGEKQSFKTDKKNAYDTAAGLIKDTAENVPFVGGLIGGGRLPISSALPDAEKLGRTWLSDDISNAKKWDTTLKEVGGSAAYLALPFGGGQLKKTWQGYNALTRGGRYTKDNEGNDILQYRMPSGGAKGLLTGAQALIFGPTATKEGHEWIESGFDSLSAKETKVYQQLVQSGTDEDTAYDIMRKLHGVKAENGTKADAEKRKIITDAKMPDAQKRDLFVTMFGDSREDELQALADAGLTFKQSMQAYNEWMRINDNEEMSGYEKATEFAAWADSQGFTVSQATAIKDQLLFSSGYQVHAERYEKMTAEGLTPDSALTVSNALDLLEPEPGSEYVSAIQKYTAIVQLDISDDEKNAALMSLMNDTWRPRYQLTTNIGITPEQYVMCYQATLDLKEATGKTRLNYGMATAAVNSIPGLTPQQRAVLWQVQDLSWKPAKNPYDPRVGAVVVTILSEKPENIYLP